MKSFAFLDQNPPRLHQLLVVCGESRRTYVRVLFSLKMRSTSPNMVSNASPVSYAAPVHL